MGRREKLVLGEVVTWEDDPGAAPKALRHYRRGAIAIAADGRIRWCGHQSRLPAGFADWPQDAYTDAIIAPGFIDTHIHFPQWRMLGADAVDLLDWLKRNTFAEEARYASRTHARAAARGFLDRLASNGTTTAVAYGSVHDTSADALFEEAAERGLSLYAGKTMMDRNAPRELRDTAAGGRRESEALISKWHGKGRLRYAITLRFAVTSTERQLAAAGELCAAHPECVFQTHLSESVGEIAAVRRQFPWAKDYTDVYDRYGLLRPRALFGHGIHLKAREQRRLEQSGSAVIHCPTSNTFLGSGLFDLKELRARRPALSIGLATDVGGGTSYSMLVTMGEAQKVAKLRGHELKASEAFYLATLGNARCLGAEHEIGSIEPGKWADLVVLDPKATPVLRERHALSRTLEDRLFALTKLGDERAVKAVYSSGKRI